MGSIYILDNNATDKMKINNTFASLFSSVLCINNKSQDGNMDLAEIEACLLTPSFSVITRANKNNGTTANIIDVLSRDSNIFAKREDKTIIKNCRKQLEEIVVNPSELFNVVVSVLKSQKNLESVNKFIWNIFDEDIVEIIPEGHRRISMYETEDGEKEILTKQSKT